jgi:hypothetical protein
MLNTSGKDGYSCHIPDFTENTFSFSPLSVILSIGLSYTAFIRLRNVSSILQSFYHEKILNFVKGCDNDCVIVVLDSIYVLYQDN